MFTGLRNLLVFRRGYTRMMADSLRALAKVVERSGVQLDPDKQRKLAMQAAPNVEQRAARATPDGPRAERVVNPPEPRQVTPAPAPLNSAIVISDDDDFEHTPIPTVTTATPVISPAADSHPPVPSVPDRSASRPGTPSVVHAFTPPRPEPVGQPAPAAAPPVVAASREPTITGGSTPIPEPPVTLEDTRPRKAASVMPEQPESTPQATESLDAAAHHALTVPIALVAPPTPVVTAPPASPEPVTQTLEVVPPVSAPPVYVRPDTPSRPIPPVTPPPDSLPERVPNEPPRLVPRADTYDTGELSIWDVFGIQAPSEKIKAELDAVVAEIRATSEIKTIPPEQAAESGTVADSASAAGSQSGQPALPARPVSALTRRASPAVRPVLNAGRPKVTTSKVRTKT
jgi:hypothetical protein